MEDNDKPIVQVKLADDRETASVIITFSFLTQTEAFGEIARVILKNAPVVNSLPEI